ncbi:MAG: hypothetical protein A2289_18540 [Deltaproteobacteria bacterium RIFOXYA12_FULL_58_15]|nr:MAG: hypothetical protein A2289_18540 [Deltaproteobacteria bacterium RIFOXYA12_FULL_58_15]OGR10606.1 MAG: hypothetical protein A2341_09675 [Deltaproteobacteria bacterium RIFOXYB12_FULL_58_9]
MLGAIFTITLIADPLAIQVIATNHGLPVVSAAQKLRAQLATDFGLQVNSQVLVPGPSTAGSSAWLDKAAESLEQAQQSYARLESGPTLALLLEVEEATKSHIDDTEAALLLAKALRLRGLTYLFMEKSQDATAAFTTAHFIDGEFSPDADQWPPEARLAYADAGAQSRQQAAGSLSIHVQPGAAAVWVDGKPVSIGSTTVTDLGAGAHYLLITSAGYEPMGAVVSVRGNAMLDQASIFLETADDKMGLLASALAEAVDGPREQLIAAQVAAVLEGTHLLVVQSQSVTSPASVIVLDLHGRRVGGAVPLVEATVAAQHIAGLLLGQPLPPPVAPAKPWYGRWYTWVAVGTVVAGGVVLGVLLGQDNPDRISFHLGGVQ